MDEKIEQRIELYSQIYEKSLQAADKLKCANAKEVAVRIFGEVARDLRSELISQLKNGNGSGNREIQPITKKQREALHRFGIKKIPENLSKKQAIGILGELVDLSKHGNNKILGDEIKSLNEKWE